MSEQLNRIEEMVGTLITMLGATNSKLGEVASDLKETKAEVETDINKLSEGQLRQDRILEMLSKRSLEQEADFKDFKRIR